MESAQTGQQVQQDEIDTDTVDTAFIRRYWTKQNRSRSDGKEEPLLFGTDYNRNPRIPYKNRRTRIPDVTASPPPIVQGQTMTPLASPPKTDQQDNRHSCQDVDSGRESETTPDRPAKPLSSSEKFRDLFSKPEIRDGYYSCVHHTHSDFPDPPNDSTKPRTTAMEDPGTQPITRQKTNVKSRPKSMFVEKSSPISSWQTEVIPSPHKDEESTNEDRPRPTDLGNTGHSAFSVPPATRVTPKVAPESAKLLSPTPKNLGPAKSLGASMFQAMNYQRMVGDLLQAQARQRDSSAERATKSKLERKRDQLIAFHRKGGESAKIERAAVAVPRPVQRERKIATALQMNPKEQNVFTLPPPPNVLRQLGGGGSGVFDTRHHAVTYNIGGHLPTHQKRHLVTAIG